MKIELIINSQEVQIIIQSALPSVKYLRQLNKKKSKFFQDLSIIGILWYSWAFKGYSWVL